MGFFDARVLIYLLRIYLYTRVKNQKNNIKNLDIFDIYKKSLKFLQKNA